MEGDRERHFYFSKGNEIQEMISSVLDQISIGIVYINEGKMVYSNKKGKEFMNLMEKDSSVQKKLDELIKKKKNFNFEIKIKKRRWIEIHGKFIENGGKKSVLMDIQDITKRKEIERELKKSKETMEKALKRERKFVEDISHYFFNPLCIAKGYIDLSIQNVDPETRRKLQITKDAVMRVETVVKHVVMEGQIYE